MEPEDGPEDEEPLRLRLQRPLEVHDVVPLRDRDPDPVPEPLPDEEWRRRLLLDPDPRDALDPEAEVRSVREVVDEEEGRELFECEPDPEECPWRELLCDLEEDPRCDLDLDDLDRDWARRARSLR